MLCKKCGETFDDELKACPKCGFKKPVGKRKKFKVELPDDIKPSIPSDDFISSNSKPAPTINKVVVDSEQTQRNKTRNTRYIDKDEEQTVAKTPVKKPTLTFETKKKEPAKPVSQKPRKPVKKPMFKVEIPDEYAALDLTQKKDTAKPQDERTKPLETKADEKEETTAPIIDTFEKPSDENVAKKVSQEAEKQAEVSTQDVKEADVSTQDIKEVELEKADTSSAEPVCEETPYKDDFELFVGEDLCLQDEQPEQDVQDQIHEVPLDLIEEAISNPLTAQKPKPLSETMQRFEQERDAKNTPPQESQEMVDPLENKNEQQMQLKQEKDYEAIARTKRQEKQLSKAEKRVAEKSLLSIKIIAVVMFILLGSLTIVSATTEFFTASSEAMMTLSFVSVSDEQTQEVQDFLSKINMLLSLESYESDDFSASEILEMIAPSSDSALYTAFFGQAELIYDNNDPAGRYIEDGERYYKIAKSEIDQIITSLGVGTVSMVIEQDYYLYEDYYYFSETQQAQILGETYSVQIDKIKQTVEGAYYAEIELLNESGKTVYNRYVVIGASEQYEVTTYCLEVLSDESLFNTFGEMKTLESDEDELYSIQREVIELETSDGIILYEYIIDYPVFEGESQLELVINQMYSDLISAYNMDTETIDAEYEVYSSGGISDDTFPMCVYIDVSVEMYSEDYLTILQQVIEEQTVQDEDTVTALYTNSLSSYNYMIQDSSAIKLSDIVGEDKTTLYEILYRLYYGYDIEEVLTGEYLETSYYSYWQQPDEDEVPDDEDGIGEDIYDGCYLLTEDGVIFFYETDFGYYEEILLDNDTISAILAMETE